MRFKIQNERLLNRMRIQELLQEAGRIENEVRSIRLPEIIDDKLRLYSRIKKDIRKQVFQARDHGFS